MDTRLANFLISLDIMWKGMFSIFVVMILLTLIVVGLTKFDKKKS